MARREEDTEIGHDPTRREFFRTFGQQTVRKAGAVMGAAAELRRASGAAARELLDMGTGSSRDPRAAPAFAEDRGATFRSAYRLAGDSLLILDQRDLPGRLTIVTCSEPTEVASAIRAGVVNSGAVLAEIAAYAIAAAVARSAGRSLEARDQLFRAAANTLRGARREVHALTAAVDRMEGRYDALTAGGDGTPGESDELAEALRAEADAIAGEAQLAHAALGRSGADLIAAAAAANAARTSTEPINLLMHGDTGPLSCGMVGTGTAILQSLMGLDKKVHVWLTEAAPGMEGARITALQLTQIDVPHTLIADTAVGWLLASRRLDGALLRGDTVATNADTVSVIGSLNVAQLSAAARVPVYVVAPLSAFDDQASSGRDLMVDLRSPAEALAGSVGSDGHARPAVFGVHLNPTADVVPGALVTAFLTETGPRAMVAA
ncbi:MAG: hypothetical protein WD830_09745 [Chloroflexota bacterium]